MVGQFVCVNARGREPAERVAWGFRRLASGVPQASACGHSWFSWAHVFVGSLFVGSRLSGLTFLWAHGFVGHLISYESTIVPFLSRVLPSSADRTNSTFAAPSVPTFTRR